MVEQKNSQIENSEVAARSVIPFAGNCHLPGLRLLKVIYILIYNYCCNPPCATPSPTVVGTPFFHFYCSHCSQGSTPKPALYNNKILPPADCAPEPTKQMVLEPFCQKYHIFPTNFNNSYLKPISSILHRSARCMIPVVARTCRICGVKNDTNFQRILTIPLFVAM